MFNHIVKNRQLYKVDDVIYKRISSRLFCLSFVHTNLQHYLDKANEIQEILGYLSLQFCVDADCIMSGFSTCLAFMADFGDSQSDKTTILSCPLSSHAPVSTNPLRSRATSATFFIASKSSSVCSGLG